MRASVTKSSSTSSKRRPARRDAYQTHRRNVARVAESSAGERSGMAVVYSPVPLVTVVGEASARRCGKPRATRVNIAQTSSGASLAAKVVITEIEWSPGGLLRLANDAAASTE